MLFEPSLQSLTKHTKFIDKLKNFIDFYSMLMIKFSKRGGGSVLPEAGETKLYFS